MAKRALNEEVMIFDSKTAELPGLLTIPENVQGMVIFAHGSGSGRLSPRNLQVAKTLNQANLGTLLFDLLTPAESLHRANVFDIPLLASRLIMATRWVKREHSIKGLPMGYFGASTGAGAALWATAELGEEISAVVSRGGRPDLAMQRLPFVTAPTLMLVGALDDEVIKLNREAMDHIHNAELVIIPGATHVFEEPGKLEEVAKEATIWFQKYLNEKAMFQQTFL